MQVFELLERGLTGKMRPFYVVCGKDDFLRRQACLIVRRLLLGDGAGSEFPSDTFITKDGDSLELATFLDELGTASLFGGKTLLRVDQADKFVSNHRQALEKHLARPTWPNSALLLVDSWPANTRLAKLTPEEALLRCDLGKEFKAAPWCQSWCKSCHKVNLSGDGARALAELVGPDLGRLDQEILKLVAALPEGEFSISARQVDQLVANGTQEIVWKIFDAMAQGRPAVVLSILDDQYMTGTAVENSMKMNGAIAYHLRRVARAARSAKSGNAGGLPGAMNEAGIRPGFPQKSAESLIRHLGARRLFGLLEELITTDMALKGGSKLPPRTVLERQLLRLSVPLSRGV